MGIWAVLESFKKNCRAKKNFIVLWWLKKLVRKSMSIFRVWDRLEMKTMKNYYDLYLKCDVLLLSDVLKQFRNSSMKNYGLCPSHYMSAHGLQCLIWQEVSLISHAGMYLFFQKDVRGGVSYISKRCSKANNKYLKFYVSRQESKYIMYLDVNKLYAYAMFKFYPTSGLNG